MLLESLNITKAEFESGTGFELKPEGACKGDVCIPLGTSVAPEGTVDVRVAAERMGLPLLEEPAAALWALGPESIGGRALTTARAPELTLPDLDGKLFSLSSLRGQKVLVYAWAPY
jgi:hypothetical protein